MKKKIIYLIAIICVFAVLTSVVYAANGYEVKIAPTSTSAKPGEDITVTFTLKNISVDPGIGAITGKIVYDKAVFEKITAANIKSGAGWGTVVYNDQEATGSEGSFAVERAAGDTIKADNLLFEVTFNVLDAAKTGTTTIKLAELSASNLEDDIEVGEQTGTVTISNAAPNTATPTPTPVKTNTPTPTPVKTNTPTPTPVKTNTPTPTPTNTNTTTPTPTPTNTNTTTPTPTKTASNTNTNGNTNGSNNTNSNGNNIVLPYAGEGDFIVPVILVITLVGIVAFVNFKKYEI